MRGGKRCLDSGVCSASGSGMSLSGSLRHREKLASIFCECEGGHLVGEPYKDKISWTEHHAIFYLVGFHDTFVLVYVLEADSDTRVQARVGNGKVGGRGDRRPTSAVLACTVRGAWSHWGTPEDI